jgi:hypothetical protein
MFLDIRYPHGKRRFVGTLDCVFEGELGTDVTQLAAELGGGINGYIQDLALGWSVNL